MAENSNGCNGNGFPSWFERISLNNAVKEEVGEFTKILSIIPENFGKVGENYSSQLIRLNVEVLMPDNSQKSVSFILKVKHDNEELSALMDTMEIFEKEEQVYHKLLPKFEELYSNVGKEIKFAPKAYRFDRDLGVDYILLEDLKTFKNSNRLEGLNMEHMKEVLQKLSAFHAASACYVEHFGMYSEKFTVGVFKEANRDLFKEFNASGPFLSRLKNLKNCGAFYEKLENSDDYLIDCIMQTQVVNPEEFNVLNHGDAWSNNIMFQYDANGTINNTLLLDFQICKYGSPIYDLYYLIFSSASMTIKINDFDYMIRYYYDSLIENLKLLQYHRPLPKLRNLHTALLNAGVVAYLVTMKVLPVVMLNKVDEASLENYGQQDSKMKLAMYTNPKYMQAVTEILPWLDNRGLLDWL